MSAVQQLLASHGASVVYSAWDSANKDADITLSSSDRNAAITNQLGSVRGTQGHSSGHWYAEIELGDADGSLNELLGLVNASATLTNNFPGQNANGWGYYPYNFSGGLKKYNNNSATNYLHTQCVVGVLVDFTAATITFYANGKVQNTAFTSISGTLYPMWGPATSGAGTRTATLNTGGSAFKYGLPSGATAWGGTWNSADKDADVTLSGSDLVASVTAAAGSVRGTQSRSSGTYYFEITTSGADVQQMPGLGKSTATLTDFPGKDANGWGFYCAQGQKYNNNTGTNYAGTGIFGVQYDASTGTLTFWRDWASLGSAYTGLSGTLYLAFGPGSSSGGLRSANINVGQAAFVFGLPSGASAWG